MGEVWVPVPGFEGSYEVSDRGRVKSLSFRNRQCTNGVPRPLILKPAKQKAGYLFLHLGLRGKKHRFLVHRLVLIGFVGPCPPGHQCAHLDGNPANNKLLNLRWVTAKANSAHKALHGTTPSGSRHWKTWATPEIAREIRRLHISGVSVCELARRYNRSRCGVQALAKGTSPLFFEPLKGDGE